MRIGIPTEVKDNEYRVAITPAGVHEFTGRGHEVFVQAGAGTGSSITDADYRAAGAKVLDTAEEVWGQAELLLKVKEPVAAEYRLLRPDLVLFTYLHLAADRALTPALIESGHDGDRLRDGAAGRPVAAPAGADERGGRPAGAAGRRALPRARARRPRGAARRGVGGLRRQGRRHRRRCLRHERRGDRAGHAGRGRSSWTGTSTSCAAADRIYQGHLQTVASNTYEVERAVLDADLVIGAVLVPGAKAPTLVTNELVSRMKPGSVLVDIAVDQGGCFEDTRPTTHHDPTFRVHNSVFYCVANMPGAVPNTSTYALTNVTLPYAVALADAGWQAAVRRTPRWPPGSTSSAVRWCAARSPRRTAWRRPRCRRCSAESAAGAGVAVARHPARG